MTDYKALLKPLRTAMADFSQSTVQVALPHLLDENCVIYMAHPFKKLQGPGAWFNLVYEPLLVAMPDLERRDFIVTQGQADCTNDVTDYWVGCAGHYVGTFVASWLDIPPTGHFAHMRFHEFYRFRDDKVIEMQVLWDIPELMMQANAWPMSPALGRQGIAMGPARVDDLHTDNDLSETNKQIVLDMLADLTKYPSQGGPEVMKMDKYWHPHFTWYGPAVVGTCRGISGFRHWHQEPFLTAMPDRGQDTQGLSMHFFADNDYVAVTGWPNMRQTLSHDGWMGIVPTGQFITLCSLDFWRIEDGLIKENWVLFDMLDIYSQLGVDVLARMREFNQAK